MGVRVPSEGPVWACSVPSQWLQDGDGFLVADAGHRLPRPFLGHTPGLECPPSSLPLAGLNVSYRTAWKALEERVQFQDEMNSCCLLAQLLHWRVMLNTLPHVISSNPQPPGKAGVIAPVSSPGGEVKPWRSGERGTESLTPSHTAGDLRASLKPELLPSAPNADTQTGKTQPPHPALLFREHPGTLTIATSTQFPDQAPLQSFSGDVPLPGAVTSPRMALCSQA